MRHGDGGDYIYFKAIFTLMIDTNGVALKCVDLERLRTK